MLRRIALALVSVLLACELVGCASHMRRRQLEAVAKEGSMAIRASQVIPVYPLTEDIQPGDVFLVTTPIQQQPRAYRRKGFLPLDQHLTRLPNLSQVLRFSGMGRGGVVLRGEVGRFAVAQ